MNKENHMPPNAGKPPQRPQPQYTTGAVLLALVVCELLSLYSGLDVFGSMADFLVICLPFLALKRLGGREIYLLGVCALLAALALFLDRPIMQMAREALSRSAYLASFILLMALLREGAMTSPAVLEVGKFLTLQPAKRRFATVFGGAHFFSVLINLGSLSLLAPIIQRGVRGDRPGDAPLNEIDQVRERRQLTAALRGFSWFLVWAPTAVTQAVMPTLMSGIQAGRLILTGLCLALVMFAVSWLEDTLGWRAFRKKLQSQGRLPAITARAFPKRAARNLALVCAALFTLTLICFFNASVTIVSAVMLAAPIIVGGWIYLQQSAARHADKRAGAFRQYNEISFITLPGYIREAVFIGCAGFIGTMAAKLVPAGEVAHLLSLATMPGWIFLTALTLSVLTFGQIGMSPITSAVFLGSLVAELPVLPSDITLAALAIAAGTAVCSTGAPYAAGPVLLARVTGHTPQTLTWKWNGRYSVIVMLVLMIIYSGLDQLW